MSVLKSHEQWLISLWCFLINGGTLVAEPSVMEEFSHWAHTVHRFGKGGTLQRAVPLQWLLFHCGALIGVDFCPVLHVTLHVACMLCPLPSTTEDVSCEFGSSKYYALCGFGGILSCGITHTAVVPLDLVKCRLQVCMAAELDRSSK